MDSEDREVHRHACFAHRERRVEHPAHAGAELAVAARGQDRADRQRRAGHIEPEAEVVHPREGHVRRADLQRHEVVAEPTEESGNHDEEHHQDAVAGDQHVPQMTVRRTCSGTIRDETRAFHTHVLNAGIHELKAHVNGECHRDKTHESRDDQVQNTDVFVVGGHEPPGEEPPVVVMILAVNGCVCHAVPPANELDTWHHRRRMRSRARFRALASRGQWARWSQGGYFLPECCGRKIKVGRRSARALGPSGGDIATADGIACKDILEGCAKGKVDIIHCHGQAQIDQ